MPAPVHRDCTFADADATYQKVIGAIAGLDDAEAMKATAKLILLLANHIGDYAVLDAAIEDTLRKDEP